MGYYMRQASTRCLQLKIRWNDAYPLTVTDSVPMERRLCTILSLRRRFVAREGAGLPSPYP